MAKTIQVRVDDQVKDSADLLFSSLGLDTSTAVRMFLIAAIDKGGIPFDVKRGSDWDLAIREAVARRQAGQRFYTIEECMAELDDAISAEAAYGAN